MVIAFLIAIRSPAHALKALSGGLLALLISGIFFLLGISSRRLRCEVSADKLRLRGDFLEKNIPLNLLAREKARIVNLNDETALRPKWKLWGTSLPGYQTGWFKLGSGEKALIFLTDKTEVVYLPTTKNYSVLLSLENAPVFLKMIQQ
jgi:hypothetical protein